MGEIDYKEVDLEYLLREKEWCLEVTPEESKEVQEALFKIGVAWVTGGITGLYTRKKYLIREVFQLGAGRTITQEKYID